LFKKIIELEEIKPAGRLRPG